MGPQNKVVALLLAVVLVCTSFAASAREVDTSLAASPTATISTIDSIGAPLSNQAASEVRGENLVLIGSYLYLGSVAVARFIGGLPFPVVSWTSAIQAAYLNWVNGG